MTQWLLLMESLLPGMFTFMIKNHHFTGISITKSIDSKRLIASYFRLFDFHTWSKLSSSLYNKAISNIYETKTTD